MNNQKKQAAPQTQKKSQPQEGQSQQGAQTKIAQPLQLIGIQELSIGSTDISNIDIDRPYPTIHEFLTDVDILKYETYAGELKTKEKADYWSADGIDHFSADLGIGIAELKVYDLSDVWLVMAYARCVTDNRTMCAAVTHDKTDRHSLEKACRRAGRNARQYLIPLVLLRDMLEEAKVVRAANILIQGQIEEAKEAAGKVMREHRQNFDSLATVPELLQHAESICGKVMDEWLVEDWNFLSAGVADIKSELITGLGNNEEYEDTDTEETDGNDFETMANQIEEGDSEEDDNEEE